MKSELRKLERSIVFRAAVVIIVAVTLCVLLMLAFVDGVLQMTFISGVTGLFQKVLGLDYYGAETLYYRIFVNNKTYWVMAGFCVLLVLCFYLFRRWFSSHYARIGETLDAISMGGHVGTGMPDELFFAEKRIVAIETLIEKKERDARAAEQRKNDLIVYLAHDIKTPLTSIIGYLSLLNETEDLTRAQRSRYVGLTLEKSYRLEQLINEFFDITRFNLQTIVLNKQQLNLRLMLDQLAYEFFPILSEQEKTIAVDAPEEFLLSADADKLARVFNNILKNALAYSYPGTTIAVSAHRDGENAFISFKNIGETIPPDGLGTIFEKFYRLDTARSSDTGGAGLGLAIAKEIVVAHGGTITAESDEHATVFTVTIPLNLKKH